MNDHIQFGSINVETGETQDGYIENGQMKFKPMKWWQKFFLKRPEKKEFLCVHTYRSRFSWSSEWTRHDVAMYKYFNPYTEEIYKIEGSDAKTTIQYDVGAFKQGVIVPIIT
jgi:hypothetical protein